MQPPTRPTPPAHGDEAALYECHRRDLERAVARVVNGSRELVEDACQNAWAIMLRAQPERTSIFGWLYVVAVREAHRLSSLERRAVRLEELGESGSWEAVVADTVPIEDVLEAREALAILADLPERQRTDLVLLVAGFSYREIAALTGGRTYTNVNKHIAKARARVRLARLHEAGIQSQRTHAPGVA